MKALTYLRAYIGLLFSVVQTTISCILVVTAAILGLQKVVDFLIRVWATLWVKAFNVKVVVEKNEFAHGSRGVLYLFNHQSFYDIFAIHSCLKNTVRFGAKIELFKIPVFGLTMKTVGALPIARENRKEVFRVYSEAQKKFEQKWSFVLAPEGTRQTEPQIGKFKKGPFIFAINAKAPIVPVVISGSNEVMPKKSIAINAGKWSRTIRLSFLAPVETSTYSVEQAGELTDKVRALFVQEYSRLESLK